MALDPITPILPPLTSIGVTTKLIDASTLQEISSSSAYVNVNSSQYLLLEANCSLGSEGLVVDKATITFKQRTSLNYGVHVYVSNAAHLVSSEELPIKTSTVNNIKTYQVDITSAVSTNFVGKHYFMILVDSEMSFYTSKSTSYKPIGAINTNSDDEEEYCVHFKEKKINKSIKDLEFGFNLLSCRYLTSLNLRTFNNELVNLPFYLVYNVSSHEITSFNSDNIITGFPKGWKLNVQQYLYQDGNNYIYIDGNYKKHIFSQYSSSGVYYDTSGGYLVLNIVSSVPQILNSNGDVLVFNSSGYLTQIKCKTKNGFYCFSLSYNASNKLTTVKDNTNTNILNITYSTVGAVLTFKNNPDNVFTLVFNSSSKLLTSIFDSSSEVYAFEYTNSSGNYLLSRVAINYEELLIYYDSSLKVSEILHKETRSSLTQIVEDISLSKLSNYTVVNNAYLGQNSLRKRTIYEFDDDGELVKEFTLSPDLNGIDLASTHQKRGVKNYYFDTFFNSNSSTFKNANNQTLAYPININSNNQIYISMSPNRMRWIYFEINSSFPMSSSTEPYDQLSINVYKAGTLVANKTFKLSYYLQKNCLFVPLDDVTDMGTNNVQYSISFSHTNSANVITCSAIKFFVWTRPVIAEICSSLQDSSLDIRMLYNTLLNTDTTPLNINGNLASYHIYKDDYFNSMMFYKKHSLMYLFLNKGKEFYIQSSGSYPLSQFRFITKKYNRLISNIKDIHDDDIFFSTISTSIISFDLTNKYRITNTIFDCYFIETSTSFRDYDYNSLLIEEHNELGQTKTYSYDAYGNNLYYITQSKNQNNTSKSITNTYSSDGTKKTSSYIGTGTYYLTYYDYYSYGSLKSVNLYGLNFITRYNYNSAGLISDVRQIFNNLSTEVMTIIHYSRGNIDRISDYYDEDDDYYYACRFETYNLYSYASYYCEYESTKSYLSNGLYVETTLRDNLNITEYYDNRNRLRRINDFSRLDKVTDNIYLDYAPYVLGYILEIDYNNDINNHNGTQYNEKHYSYSEYGDIAGISELYSSMSISYSVDSAAQNSYAHVKIYQFNNSSNTPIRTESLYSYVDRTNGTRLLTNIGDRSISCSLSYDDDSPFDVPIQYISVKANNNVIASYQMKNVFIYDSPNQIPLVASSNLSVNNQTSISIVSYQYHQSGNISSISSSTYGYSCSYTYNNLNQISQEVHGGNSTFGTIQYQYDDYGNITKIIRNGTVIDIGYNVYNQISMVKQNSVSIGTISYGGEGCLTHFGSVSLGWSKGLLTSYGSYSFEYDCFDRRTKKILNNSNNTEYKYADNKLLSEIKTINNTAYVLEFLYSPNNEIIGIKQGNDCFTFVKDILGNVVAIYWNNILQAKYIYDAYGNHIILDASNNAITSPTDIANLNPIRYRSYYYDVETGLYYLKSRYYSPFVCRFISQDSLDNISPHRLIGVNLHAYCYNNPIMYVDRNGNFPVWASLLIGAGIGLTTTFIKDWSDDGTPFNGSVGFREYFGSALGNAVSWLGASFISTVMFSGLGNVIQSMISEDINSIQDLMKSFGIGAAVGAIGYAVTSGIRTIGNKIAFREISSNANIYRINRNLAASNFVGLPIGKIGCMGARDALYRQYGFRVLEEYWEIVFGFLSSI